MALLTFLLADNVPHLREGLTEAIWAIPLHVMTAATAIAAFLSLLMRKYWWARTAAIAQVTLIVWGWALTQYPYLVRPHLTFQAAAAPRETQILLLQTLAVGAVILFPSLIYLFRIFGPREKPA
jgi:cytochrome d ubiquinol oxidase subunit II